ncbi:MAG TPA: chromate transporter [Kofleriaceae bacterium]|nr:chromate transporter [Kofleriaceae bacterium]
MLGQLALLFLRLGATAFGGPAAHVALMEDEVVRKRAWISREEFLDLVAACNLIPGPNSTELAIHIGHRKAGWAGLLVAGACFIFPAALIVGVIAWAYVRWGALPEVGYVLYGVKPVIIAVVAWAIWRLARTAMRTWVLGALAAASVAAVVAGVNELVVLLGAGVLAMAGIAGGRAIAVAPVVPLVKLFGVFAKIGAVLFGSGYVLLAFLRSDLVDRLHWLTESQLLDAIAVGQITPGPVFTTATFVGYVLDGGAGAVVATLGIFAPAFVFVALSGPLVPRLRRSRVAGAFLDGVVVASLALMGVVAVQLGHAALVDAPTIVIAIASLGVLVRWPNSSLLLAAGGALVGVLLHAA